MVLFYQFSGRIIIFPKNLEKLLMNKKGEIYDNAAF